MRAMKDSGVEWVGQIPSDWATRRIKTVAAKSQEKDNYHGEAYIGLENIESWTGKYVDATSETTNQVDSVVASYSEKSVLFGKLRPYLAKVFRPYNSGQCSTEILVLNPYDVNRDYLFWNMVSGAFIDEVNSSTYGAKMPRANWEFIGTCHIPYPKDTEQSRIASFLDAKCAQIDAIIEKQHQVIEKLKAYKQSVITEAVTKGLDPTVPMKDSGVEWIGNVPEHWDILKLRAHTSMLTPMRDRPEDLSGEIPWVRIEDYSGKYISESREGLGVSPETVKLMNLKIYPVGTILCTSSCDLGKCAIVSRELVSNQRFIGIIPDSETNVDYLYYLMLSNAERLNHLSTGTIQANLSRVAFEHLMVQFPPISEQREISTYLDKKCDSLDTIVSKKQAAIKKLTDYKKSLIYEAVTGKMEV